MSNDQTRVLSIQQVQFEEILNKQLSPESTEAFYLVAEKATGKPRSHFNHDDLENIKVSMTPGPEAKQFFFAVA